MKIAKKSKKIYLLFKFTKKKLLSLLVIEKIINLQTYYLKLQNLLNLCMFDFHLKYWHFQL